MKKTIFITISLLLSLELISQEKADSLWQFNGVTSINFSQMSLSNWAAGGENSVSGNAVVNLNANYKSPDQKISWRNELLMGFGLLQQGDDPVRKSDDKIDMASKFGYKASNTWFYSGLLSFKTQFSEGFSNPGDENRTKISNIMAPGYLNLSLGMDYKPSDNFTMLLSPAAGKVTFVLDDELAADGAYGLGPSQKVRSEFGGYIKVAYTKEILKNVKLNTKIDFFSNYLDNPQYIDVNFDLLLSFKVNEYISTTFISQLIYDRDIQFDVLDSDGSPTGDKEPRIQFKELFGIGLTYSF